MAISIFMPSIVEPFLYKRSFNYTRGRPARGRLLYMKIVLATPLYPPDIAAPAPYVKELARRLSARHEVTIVAYAHLPEQVPGVRIVAVRKRRMLLVRLFFYTLALWRAARNADILYIQNGASVELPAGAVKLFLSVPFFIRIGDSSAHARAAESMFLGFIERFARRFSSGVLVDMLPQRPEILPFEPRPAEKLASYEEAWREHLHALENKFAHAK